MRVLHFIGGFGPVEVGLIFLLFAILGGYWVYRNATREGRQVEWYWVIGIGALFLLGILPGLIGIWLYIATKRAETREEDGTSSSATEPTNEVVVGVLIFLVAALMGGFGTYLVDVLSLTGESGFRLLGGFVVGAVFGFILLSYLLYGR